MERRADSTVCAAAWCAAVYQAREGEKERARKPATYIKTTDNEYLFLDNGRLPKSIDGLV